MFQPRYTEEDKAAEVERFERAIDQAHEDLTRLKEKLEAEFPEHTHLLDLHLLILKDQMLYDEPLRFIKEGNLNAEWALFRSFERVRELFSRIEDPYIKGRIQDVESVYRRLLGNLSGKDHRRYFSSPEPLILVARDLSPAETSQMAGSKVLGFITERGGKTSHTALMAQSMEIPAAVGLDNATRVKHGGGELRPWAELRRRDNPTLPMPYEVSAGDAYDLWRGCDKKFSTCKADGFQDDFGGEPNVPTQDEAMQYKIPQ